MRIKFPSLFLIAVVLVAPFVVSCDSGGSNSDSGESNSNGSNDGKVYSEDFSGDPEYESLYQDTDDKTEVYWDETSGNYYAKVRDQDAEAWWALGKSPEFDTFSPDGPFRVSFEFNPVKSDWGHYPGISFVESDPSSNPRELSRSFTFQIRESDNYDKELSLTNSEGDRYSTPTVPAEDEWYEVTIEYDPESETIDLSVLREDGLVFVDETRISIPIYNSFNQILIGETQGDGIKYGDQAQIRVDDIMISEGSDSGEENAEVEGKAVKPNGNALAGMEVELLGEDQDYVTTTDGSGGFTKSVEPGTYKIRGNAIDGETYLSVARKQTSVSVDQGETTSVTLDTEKGYYLDLRNVTLGGQQGTVSASPGESLDLSFDYTAWSRSGLTSAVVYAAAGIEGTGKQAASLGIPGGNPGEDGSVTLTLTAPSTSGTYTVYVFNAPETSESDALNRYENRFPDEDQFIPVATLEVTAQDGTGNNVYSEDFSGESDYEVLYQDTDAETEVYWDEINDNYYAKVRDQEAATWWALGKSPAFSTVGSADPFTVSFEFNPVEPDYGHYPGISFVESNPSANPRELSRSFNFEIRWSDNYNKELSVTNSDGDRYATPTIPAEDEWYQVKIQYNPDRKTMDLSVLREDGSTFVNETGISIPIYNSFDQILIGETQGDGIKYGEQAQIRVDDIQVSAGSE